MNSILKVFLFIGTIFYASLLLYTFQSPEKIEKDATWFIKYQLKKELKQKIETFESSKSVLNKFAKKLIIQNNIRTDILKVLEKKIPSIISKMQDKNCECRQKYKNIASTIIQSEINLLKNTTEKLKDFLKFKYMQIVKNLIFDIRTFLVINFIIFLLLLIFLFIKPKANLQILFVSSLLVISCLISAYFYVFEQNWFFTILYNDFVGYFYIFYIGILFFFLWDIILNKARFTTEIFNFLMNLIGSGINAISC